MSSPADLSSGAPGSTPTPPAGAGLFSGRGIRPAPPRRAGVVLALLLASGCTALPLAPEPRVLQTQVGPIGVQVRGFVGGLTNADAARLVQAGVVEACPGRGSTHPGEAGGPQLSMIWHLNDAGGPSPTVTIAARLFNTGHQVSFAFDHTLSPDVAANGVFAYAVSGVTCDLLSKAGYLGGAQPMSAPIVSQPRRDGGNVNLFGRSASNRASG
jgi:hypothetical protein